MRGWDLLQVSDLWISNSSFRLMCMVGFWISSAYLRGSESSGCSQVTSSFSFLPTKLIFCFSHSCFSHSSGSLNQKLRWSNHRGFLLSQPRVQLESKFYWSYILNLSMPTSSNKIQVLIIIPYIIRIIPCFQSGLSYISTFSTMSF